MHATDIQVKLEAQIKESIDWHGHVIYKRQMYSALELLGTQQESKNGNGFTTPLKYAKADAEYGTETLFWMNINDAGSLASGNIELFGMSFPMKGFVNVGKDGRMSVTLSADIEDKVVKQKDGTEKTYQSSYNYIMEKIKNGEKNKKGEDFKPFVIEAPGELTEEALIAYTESLEGWEEWKERNFKARLKETDVASPLLAGIPTNEVPF